MIGLNEKLFDSVIIKKSEQAVLNNKYDYHEVAL